ncbi:LRR-containing protein [Histomonas meleagridis]|uniref:LRR-containing protein n=1 Tax=Histomonas meleagridis TaxID=135588 RepID=UPI0035596410|nr:LRR-containing protein [Histomonas meleagridis]KAH0805786.1 LRR-containing protein [Histomonas meleagridis]
MPPRRRKRPRRLRPYEKVQNFLDLYKKIASIYDVPTLNDVEELYGPIVEKHGKRIPQLLQFAEETVAATRLRPLIDAFQQSDVRVRFLSFLNTNTGDDGLHVLAHALQPPLEVAGIAYHANNVSSSGCRGFARSMITSKSLAILELDFNPNIGDEGVIGLTAYGHCPTLTKLSLRFCDISDTGAIAISKWLTQDTCRIKELLLNGNKIGPIGATAIGQSLGKNKSLTRIDLSDNIFGFDRDALIAIHDGIIESPTLKSINMLNHFECPEGIGEKYFELTKNKPLCECVLTVKMDAILFKNIKATALINKRKMLKEERKRRLEAKKAAQNVDNNNEEQVKQEENEGKEQQNNEQELNNGQEAINE